MRIDDIDQQRSRREYAAAALEDIEWLGLDWDATEDCGNGIISQSQRRDAYLLAIDTLRSQNFVYPCFCSRKDLRSLASAPQIGDMGAPYPGICRTLAPDQIAEKFASGKKAALRLKCPPDVIFFEDAVQGAQLISDFGGDFALCRSDGVIAYQLATVVDDAWTGVNFVLRGRDLLPSTARQIILLKLLGWPVPAYAHVPLLLDHEGSRLAKRHKSLSLRALRECGVAPEKITGFLGWLAGINPDAGPASPREMLGAFNPEVLPREDIFLPAAIVETIEGKQKFF